MLYKKLRKPIVASSFFSIFSATALVVMPSFSNAALLPIVPMKQVAHQGFADLVERIKPAVVSVQVRSDETSDESDFTSFFDFPNMDALPDDSPIKRFFKDFDENFTHMKKSRQHGRLHLVAQGSGFFISSDGYVVTNYHVVNEGTAFSVILDNGKELKAKLLGSDSRTDIALLKVEDAKSSFPFVKFADDSKVRVGDWVVAVGNPFGLGGTVTAGIVSARGRDIGASAYDDFIQIDAAVNRGNSGGPTFDLSGAVVGINTAIYSPSGGSVGIAFAIPSSTAQSVVAQLKAKGAVERGWIGVQIQPITKEIADSIGLVPANGAIIADTTKDGPAYKAGLKSGDAIVAVNGAAVKDARDLAKKIADIAPQHTADLSLWRAGKKETVKITVQPMPKDKTRHVFTRSAEGSKDLVARQFGLSLRENAHGKGLLIIHVDADSDAADKGLRSGDILKAVNNQKVDTLKDFSQAIELAKKSGRNAVLFQIEDNEQNRFVALPLKN
ncbi:MAG: Do family serine endopeptidase [Alphaproteobacteria bacterium]|nr:Do family serine endopeptidase [Alphaproteobacteria bacterium]